MRLFSFKRLCLALLLGFLLPFSYAFALSLLTHYTGPKMPGFLIIPVGWPLNIFVALIGQIDESNMVSWAIFFVLANITLYGTLSYAALSMLTLIRHKRNEPLPPLPTPTPEKSSTYR